MKTIIIVASARKNGNTNTVALELAELANCDIFNLSDYNILPFDYDYQNQEDDFIPLITQLIEEYELLIFATPVYWYAMSGVLKNFFDRFTDLITVHKELGRKLKGKHCAVVTSSAGDHLEDQFWIPFQKTTNYLNINFKGGIHTHPEKDRNVILKSFWKKIQIHSAKLPKI